uniref:Uncharacterized protein n=1 Tax=Lactuca sativa TaxID=4236 RepID=A0A9R1VJE3_LACSA|nr:hypothetical protein LSAT_V11C500263090 [Lactuca sativa]
MLPINSCFRSLHTISSISICRFKSAELERSNNSKQTLFPFYSSYPSLKFNKILSLGLAYTVTRFFYSKGYSSGDPKGCLPIGGFNGLEEAKINYDPN